VGVAQRAGRLGHVRAERRFAGCPLEAQEPYGLTAGNGITNKKKIQSEKLKIERQKIKIRKK
jgi:hypothetical protein